VPSSDADRHQRPGTSWRRSGRDRSDIIPSWQSQTSPLDIEAAKRAEFDYDQKGRALGSRFIGHAHTLIRAMLEAALAFARSRREGASSGRSRGSPQSGTVAGQKNCLLPAPIRIAI
jgi:hypothetical protein